MRLNDVASWPISLGPVGVVCVQSPLVNNLAASFRLRIGCVTHRAVRIPTTMAMPRAARVSRMVVRVLGAC